MDLELEGTTALVMASTSGLGKAAARTLAAEGANVVCNGRNQQRVDAAVADLTHLPGTVMWVTADLTAVARRKPTPSGVLMKPT